MAVCLGCGSPLARVVESRSIHLGTGERQNWRTVVCPPAPDGCGTRRRQVVRDDGEVPKTWMPRPYRRRISILRVGSKP